MRTQCGGIVGSLQQASYEIEELRVAAEYDMEDPGTTLKFVGDLEQSMRALCQAMEAGTCRFENRNLPFMEVGDKYDTGKLPFRHLLRQINETHRQGLDVEQMS